MIFIGIVGVILFFVLLAIILPIKNEYGTFGDDDYDYEGEIRARGWDKM